MSDVSGHNDSSILRDFSAEYELLCSQNREQAAKLEELHQESHSLRNRLQVSEKIQTEYQLELECQQQQLVEANESHAAIVAKLKEDHASHVKDIEEKVLSLQNGLCEVQQQHAFDKEELLKARKELRELHDTSPVATLKAELQEIMEEHAANRVACVQHQELNKILLESKADLMEELNIAREHLSMTEEKLKIYKADLMEQSETLEDLRESLAVAQNELSCLKAGPADAGRGNSLFAEVEDKRQDMLKKCASLSKKYNEMKKDYSAKCAEISRLKLENLKLRRKWQEEAEERDNRDVWLGDNYEIRIKELTKMVEDLKQEEKPVFIQGDSKILTYAEHVVKESREKISQLREEMEWRSSQRLNEAQALYLARSEVQTLKAEVMSLYAENLVLRDKPDEANITDIPSSGNALRKIKEALHKMKEIPVPCSPKLASTVCEEVSGYSDSTPHCQNAAHTNASPISSKISNSVQPKQLMEEKLMGKLQPKGTCTESSNEEEKLQPEEDFCIRTNEEDVSSVKAFNEDEKPEYDLSIGREESITGEDDDMQQQENGSFNSVEAGGHLDFICPSLIKPVSVVISEKCNAFQTDGEGGNMNCNESDSKDEGEPSLTVEELSRGVNENQFELQTERHPRQSILAKASRPSLLPIDQNSMRKVRFAGINTSCPLFVESNKVEEENKMKSQKKKLVRIPQSKSYKTKIIVSKELD